LIRRNYFIKDEYGTIWNDEPFTTFKQAWDFKNFMIPNLNSARLLKIVSTIREVIPEVKRLERAVHLHSDF
jgi:hypothetical protein